MNGKTRWLDDEAGWHPAQRPEPEPVKLKGWNLEMMDGSAMPGFAPDLEGSRRYEEERAVRAKLRARVLAEYDRTKGRK